MKAQNIFFTLFLMVSFTLTSAAQSLTEVFDPNAPVVWLGLDFSNAKFIGDREKYGSLSDVRFLIKSWNDLMETEKDKYNISKSFKKVKVDTKIDVTRDHNEEVEVEDMLTNDPSGYDHIRREDIEAIVSNYDFKGLQGTGLMFNIESFNKIGQKAALWITFIDMGSKEVLLTERMEEPPGGSGVRNYWAGSIAGILKRIEKKEFELWKKNSH